HASGGSQRRLPTGEGLGEDVAELVGPAAVVLDHAIVDVGHAGSPGAFASGVRSARARVQRYRLAMMAMNAIAARSVPIRAKLPPTTASGSSLRENTIRPARATLNRLSPTMKPEASRT